MNIVWRIAWVTLVAVGSEVLVRAFLGLDYFRWEGVVALWAMTEVTIVSRVLREVGDVVSSGGPVYGYPNHLVGERGPEVNES